MTAAPPPPALEARGIVKAFPGVVANDHVDFDLRTRRGPCPARRERRRQEHADEHPGRAVPARRGRDPARRRGRSPSARRATRSPPASGWSTSTSRSSRRRPSPRTSCSACDQPRFRLRPAPIGGRDRRARRRRFGLRVDPARQDLAAVGRRAAAGRDPQDALPRRPDPDHGRADRGPRPAGDRRAVPRRCGR